MILFNLAFFTLLFAFAVMSHMCVCVCAECVFVLEFDLEEIIRLMTRCAPKRSDAKHPLIIIIFSAHFIRLVCF